MRITIFCAQISKTKFHNFAIKPVIFSWQLLNFAAKYSASCPSIILRKSHIPPPTPFPSSSVYCRYIIGLS